MGKKINSEPMRELLTMLTRGDQRIFSHLASRPENIEKLHVRYSISKHRMTGDVVNDLYLCLGCMLAQQFIELYCMADQSNMPALRGFVVLYWKFFASPTLTKHPAILDACRNPDAADKFQHFLSDSLGDGTIPSEEMRKWFAAAFGNQSSSASARFDADRRNLGRHEQKALEYFSKALYQIAPSIFLEPKLAEMPLDSKAMDRETAISLLRKLALDQCAFAPIALGIAIPILR